MFFLFFLSANDVIFTKKCDNPWYTTTTPVQGSGLSDEWKDDTNVRIWIPDELARVLVCVSRYQFCNANFSSAKSRSGKSKSSQSCTPLAGLNSSIEASDAVWQTDEQRNFFNASFNNILFGISDTSYLVAAAGITTLKTRDNLFFGIQNPLSHNQWQLKIENWYDATLTNLQKLRVEYATVLTKSALLQVLERPQTENERQLCHNVVSIFTFSLSKLKYLF